MDKKGFRSRREFQQTYHKDGYEGNLSERMEQSGRDYFKGKNNDFLNELLPMFKNSWYEAEKRQNNSNQQNNNSQQTNVANDSILISINQNIIALNRTMLKIEEKLDNVGDSSDDGSNDNSKTIIINTGNIGGSSGNDNNVGRGNDNFPNNGSPVNDNPSNVRNNNPTGNYSGTAGSNDNKQKDRASEDIKTQKDILNGDTAGAILDELEQIHHHTKKSEEILLEISEKLGSGAGGIGTGGKGGVGGSGSGSILEELGEFALLKQGLKMLIPALGVGLGGAIVGGSMALGETSGYNELKEKFSWGNKKSDDKEFFNKELEKMGISTKKKELESKIQTTETQLKHIQDEYNKQPENMKNNPKVKEFYEKKIEEKKAELDKSKKEAESLDSAPLESIVTPTQKLPAESPNSTSPTVVPTPSPLEISPSTGNTGLTNTFPSFGGMGGMLAGMMPSLFGNKSDGPNMTSNDPQSPNYDPRISSHRHPIGGRGHNNTFSPADGKGSNSAHFDDNGNPNAIQHGTLAEVTQRGESRGNYGIANYFDSSHKLKQTHFDPDNMTVGDVMKAQSEGKIFAAGGYQMIPNTLAAAVAKTKTDPNQKFDKQTQDQLYSHYLITDKQKAVGDYITGKSDNIDAARLGMANEWAAIQYNGIGRYDKDGINHASVPDSATTAALKQAREIYAKTGDMNQAVFGFKESVKTENGTFGKPDLAFGDSTAHKLGLPGDSKDSRQTKDSLAALKEYVKTNDVKGKNVVISSNSNTNSEQGMKDVQEMATILKEKGANVNIMGTGKGGENGMHSLDPKYNDQLKEWAGKNGVAFTPMGKTSDSVHEADPKAQIEAISRAAVAGAEITKEQSKDSLYANMKGRNSPLNKPSNPFGDLGDTKSAFHNKPSNPFGDLADTQSAFKNKPSNPFGDLTGVQTSLHIASAKNPQQGALSQALTHATHDDMMSRHNMGNNNSNRHGSSVMQQMTHQYQKDKEKKKFDKSKNPVAPPDDRLKKLFVSSTGRAEGPV